MKSVKIIMKVIAALAAIAGVVYIVATYGEKIVAWAKKMLESCPVCNCVKDNSDAETDVSAQGAAEEPVSEGVPTEAVAAQEDAPVAEESDFEG